MKLHIYIYTIYIYIYYIYIYIYKNLKWQSVLSAGYTYANIKFNNINYNFILTQTLKSENRSPENIKNQASLKRGLKAFF